MLSISKNAREKMESVCREARDFAEAKWLEIGFDSKFKELHISDLVNNFMRGYLDEVKKIIIRLKKKGFEEQYISEVVKITIEEIEAIKEYFYL
jgi:hypothetical protein